MSGQEEFATPVPEDLIADMKSRRIDVDLTRRILDRYNAGGFSDQAPVSVAEIPALDGERILDMTGDFRLERATEEVQARARDLGLEADLVGGRREGGTTILNRDQLALVGRALYPKTSLGVLNGGSATSYADVKKNEKLNGPLLDLVRDSFDRLAELASGRPKGITPAYINPDGSLGASFLELKMRSLLIEALKTPGRYRAAGGAKARPLYPLFQMSSIHTDGALAEEYDRYKDSPLLEDLIGVTGLDITEVVGAVQPLIAAYTHSSDDVDGRKGIFGRAHGIEGNTLPLPGGHGQNFAVLREVYRGLLGSGKRFVYLGNVDNLGFTVNPETLGYFALSDRCAAFEFTFRTAVDVKGGILVRDKSGGLNCGDIGPAVSADDVFAAEEAGKQILFNCATGLFDLARLVADLDRIIHDLPTRFSDQDKDAGRYSQAEQVTWEVLGLLDDFLVFGVDKYRRFISAKMLLETLMTSGVALDSPDYPTDQDPARDTRRTAELLHRGFARLMDEVYGMELVNGTYRPLPLERL